MKYEKINNKFYRIERNITSQLDCKLCDLYSNIVCSCLRSKIVIGYCMTNIYYKEIPLMDMIDYYEKRIK
jgi:hypothetical protein